MVSRLFLCPRQPPPTTKTTTRIDRREYIICILQPMMQRIKDVDDHYITLERKLLKYVLPTPPIPKAGPILATRARVLLRYSARMREKC